MNWLNSIVGAVKFAASIFMPGKIGYDWAKSKTEKQNEKIRSIARRARQRMPKRSK